MDGQARPAMLLIRTAAQKTAELETVHVQSKARLVFNTNLETNKLINCNY